MRFHRWLLIGMLAWIPGYAQSGAVSAPMMGFAFDSAAAAIRPIRGVPGAALLGDPLDVGFAMTMAAIAPRQEFALAVAAEDSRVKLVGLAGGIGNGALPEAAMSAPERIGFSPAGTAALLYGTSRLQVVYGLPAQAAVREIDLSALAASPAAMAVSDDGAVVAVSGAGAVWAVNAEGTASQLALPGTTAALAFRAGSHDLVAVSATGDVHVVRDAGNESAYRLVYAADAQTANPVAAQFSAGGTHVYTANESGTIAAIEIAGGALRTISCGCRVTALEALSGRDLFRLTAAGRSVLMLFDGARAETKVWFVPPGGAARETEGSVQ